MFSRVAGPDSVCSYDLLHTSGFSPSVELAKKIFKQVPMIPIDRPYAVAALVFLSHLFLKFSQLSSHARL